MVTIYDVARVAGVSPKTVSRVMNGDAPVNAKTREIVTRAMGQLGYVPSSAARTMRSHRTGLVGLVTGAIARPNAAGEAGGLPDLQIVQGIQRVLAESGLTLLIILILILATRRALQPLQLLGAGFDALEQGRFDARLPPIAVPELTRIGEQFNSLGHRLRRSSDDNHLLIDRLMSLQEEERKTLARELHDAFGPALFAIRTDVAALARLASAGPGRVDEMVGLTRSVDGIVEDLQQTNYRLLEQLRPIVLDELGLAEALQQLVERHRHRFPRLRWSFELAPDAVMPAEPMALSLYRIVQECLTDAVRHAHARHVALLLAAAPEAASAASFTLNR